MFDFAELEQWDNALAVLANARHIPQDRKRPEGVKPRPGQTSSAALSGCPFAHERAQA